MKYPDPILIDVVNRLSQKKFTDAKTIDDMRFTPLPNYLCYQFIDTLSLNDYKTKRTMFYSLIKMVQSIIEYDVQNQPADTAFYANYLETRTSALLDLDLELTYGCLIKH